MRVNYEFVLDLDASGLHDTHSHPELGGLPVLDPLLQLGPGSARDGTILNSIKVLFRKLLNSSYIQ